MLIDIPRDCLYEVISFLESRGDFLSFILVCKYFHERGTDPKLCLFSNLFFPIRVNLCCGDQTGDCIDNLPSIPPFFHKVDLSICWNEDEKCENPKKSGKLFGSIRRLLSFSQPLKPPVVFKLVAKRLSTQIKNHIISSRLTGLRINFRIDTFEADADFERGTMISKQLYHQYIEFAKSILESEEFPFQRIESFGMKFHIKCTPRKGCGGDKIRNNSFFQGKQKNEELIPTVDIEKYLKRMTSLRSLCLFSMVNVNYQIISLNDFPCFGEISGNGLSRWIWSLRINLREQTNQVIGNLCSVAPITNVFVEFVKLDSNPFLDVDLTKVKRLKISFGRTARKGSVGMMTTHFLHQFSNLISLEVSDPNGCFAKFCKVTSSTSLHTLENSSHHELIFPFGIEYSVFESFERSGFVLEQLCVSLAVMSHHFLSRVGKWVKKLQIIHSRPSETLRIDSFKAFENLEEIEMWGDNPSSRVTFNENILKYLPKVQVVRASNTLCLLMNLDSARYLQKNPQIRLIGFKCCEKFVRQRDLSRMKIVGHETCVKRVLACQECHARWMSATPKVFCCKGNSGECRKQICEYCAKKCCEEKCKKRLCDKCMDFCDYCYDDFCKGCQQEHEIGCALKDGCSLM